MPQGGSAGGMRYISGRKAFANEKMDEMDFAAGPVVDKQSPGSTTALECGDGQYRVGYLEGFDSGGQPNQVVVRYGRSAQRV